MAEVTFEFTAANVARLVEAYGSSYVENEEETKAQFAKRVLLQDMKSRVIEHERAQLVEALDEITFDGTVS